MSKSVKVTAWRSASSAVGASTILPEGARAGTGLGGLVVWPFSSMERERMTLPVGCWLCGETWWRAVGVGLRGGEELQDRQMASGTSAPARKTS